MTLHETKSAPLKQAASPDATGWLTAKRKRALIPWLFLAPALIIHPDDSGFGDELLQGQL